MKAESAAGDPDRDGVPAIIGGVYLDTHVDGMRWWIRGWKQMEVVFETVKRND